MGRVQPEMHGRPVIASPDKLEGESGKGAYSSFHDVEETYLKAYKAINGSRS